MNPYKPMNDNSKRDNMLTGMVIGLIVGLAVGYLMGSL